MPTSSDMLEVTLLTRQGCGLCNDVHTLLERLAQEYSLALTIQDVNSPDGMTVAERAGSLFVPVVLIEGEPVASGRISERRLRNELARRLRDAPGQPVPAVADQQWLERISKVLRWLVRSW